jgi:hypothetical protein
MHQLSTGKGSLTGKAVVPKTAAGFRVQVRVLSLPPIWTCSSVESERDTAKVEVVRSSRTRSTIFRTRSSVGIRTVVFETTSRRFKSCRVHHTGVAQLE